MSDKKHGPEQLVRENGREQLSRESLALWRANGRPDGRAETYWAQHEVETAENVLSTPNWASVCDLRLPTRRLRR